MQPGRLSASDGVEPIGTSVQSTARGGADVAVGDTALSQISNPATLTLMPRKARQLDTTGEIGFLDGPWRGPFGIANTARRVVPLANAGVSIPNDDRLTLGAAFNSRAGLATGYDQRFLLIPFMKRHVSSDMKVLNFPLNAAYRVSDKLSLGAGARVEFVTARFDSVFGPADLDFGRGETFGSGFDLGLLYRPRQDWTFGLAYRSPTWCGDLEGGRGKASILGLLPVPLGDIGLDNLRLPQKVTAGAAWDITSRLKLASEVRWINYRSSTLNQTMIQTDGAIDIRAPLPLGYRDVWAFMVGPQYQLSKRWTVAAGYHYSTPAIPADHLLPIGSVLSCHHGTTGIWYQADRWWAGVAYVIAFPESLHGNGCSCIPFGIDYACSSLRNMQQAVAIGFGCQW